MGSELLNGTRTEGITSGNHQLQIVHAKRCSYLVALALEVISDLGKTGTLADTIHTTEYNAIHFALFSCFLDIVKKIEVRLGGENATYGILQCLGHNRRNPME